MEVRKDNPRKRHNNQKKNNLPDNFQLRTFLKGYGCQFGTPLNAVASIVSTLAGISMEVKEEQSEKAP